MSIRIALHLCLLACACTRVQTCPQPSSATGSARSTPTESSIQQTTSTDSLALAIQRAEPFGLAQATIRLTLRNASHRDAIWMNSRMAIYGTRSWTEVWLDVEHVPTRKRFEASCHGLPVPARREYYILLRPLDEFTTHSSLACFPFPDRGPWRITAHYRDMNKTPPRPPKRVSWFSGTLTSNTIEMEVRDVRELKALSSQVPPTRSDTGPKEDTDRTK
jgi:hypothetical protein